MRKKIFGYKSKNLNGDFSSQSQTKISRSLEIILSINPESNLKSAVFFFYNSELVCVKLFHYEKQNVLNITYIINNLINRNNIKFDSKQFIIL